MSLLRASSGAVGEDADLSATVGKNVSETGVVHGDLLVRYAEAVHERGDIVGALDDIAEALGADAAYEAAIATVANNPTMSHPVRDWLAECKASEATESDQGAP